jgi:hypothetical protein
MKKRIEGATHNKTISMRAPPEFHAQVERMAEQRTRGISDQLFHMLRIAVIVTDSAGTDDIEVIRRLYKLKAGGK